MPANATPPQESASPDWTDVGDRVRDLRILVGLAQGLLFYALIGKGLQTWRNAHADLVIMAWPVVLAVPLLLLVGAGRLRPRILMIWVGAATLGLAGLGLYQHWSAADGLESPDFLLNRASFNIIFGWAPVWAMLYILHHLIEGCDTAGSLKPDYALLFDRSWRRAFQLVMSVCFAGALFGLLFLGGAMFKLVGVSFLLDMMTTDWFSTPLWFGAFATAVHLTDVRPALIKGVRTVVLTLNAWLLPVIVAISAGFLLLLPFTGLDKLWSTRAATAILLSAAGALVILINAAYQDGDPTRRVSQVLSIAGRVGAVLLTPLTLIAAYAVWLRGAQYGLTPERVIAIAVLTVAAVYAAGYLVAAVRGQPWLKPIEPVNLIASVVIALVVISLFAGLADPRRLAVDNQIARLQHGRVKAEAFDYRFLRFKSGRFGQAALRRLSTSDRPEIASRARVALSEVDEFAQTFGAQGQVPKAVEPPLSHAVILPTGAVLPEGFSAFVKAKNQPTAPGAPPRQSGFGGPECLHGPAVCTLVVRDLDHDGLSEVIVSEGALMLVYGQTGGKWDQIGSFLNADCRTDAQSLARLETVRPLYDDLLINGARIPFAPSQACEPPATATRPVKK